MLCKININICEVHIPFPMDWSHPGFLYWNQGRLLTCYPLYITNWEERNRYFSPMILILSTLLAMVRGEGERISRMPECEAADDAFCLFVLLFLLPSIAHWPLSLFGSCWMLFLSVLSALLYFGHVLHSRRRWKTLSPQNQESLQRALVTVSPGRVTITDCDSFVVPKRTFSYWKSSDTGTISYGDTFTKPTSVTVTTVLWRKSGVISITIP